MTLPANSIIFHEVPAPAEVLRIDAQGFHYRGQLIEDAGEAHRLLLEFLYKQQPKPASVCNGLEEFCVNWWGSDTDEPTVTEAIEKGTMASFAEAVLARWGK